LTHLDSSAVTLAEKQHAQSITTEQDGSEGNHVATLLAETDAVEEDSPSFTGPRSLNVSYSRVYGLRNSISDWLDDRA